MLRTFIRGARLRRWLARTDCPPSIKECKRLFDNMYASMYDQYPEEHHNDANDSFGGTPQTIPDELRLLVKRNCTLRARHRHNGVVYAISSAHMGNSLVLFYANGKTGSSIIPGCIQYIVSQEKRLIFAVRRHLPANGSLVDPFNPYPHFPAKLYCSNLAKELELVPADGIIGHFARWPISSSHVVILHLSRD